MSELERGGVHSPGNAPGLSSRVLGAKTELTSSSSFVQPGGGSFFAATHAVTIDSMSTIVRCEFCDCRRT